MTKRWPTHWRELDHDPSAVVSARTSRSWSQVRLARELGISRSLVCEIEAGDRNATPAMLRRIARALGVPVAGLRRAPP